MNFLAHQTVRNILYQVLAIGIIAGIIGYLVLNLQDNLAQRNIATGFGFLDQEASFAISESLIDYTPADSYGRAIVVGLLNTLRVSVIGIALATALGFVIGVARLSQNWLVSKLALIYIDTIRNLPLLLQLFFWYSLLTLGLPGPREALSPISGVFLSNRGLFFTVFAAHPAWGAMLLALAVGVFLTWASAKLLIWRQNETGKRFPLLPLALGFILGLPLIVYVLYGAPSELNIPLLAGFNFRGGMALTPELGALLFSLVLYTAAFIAEIVRGGILGVPSGQAETGFSLGLRPGQVLSLVLIPQALRIIVPPLTSQYLNLTKNSSLAVAIGYPDLVNIINTTINQKGQAVEGILIMMSVYLSISLMIALFMNWYNASVTKRF